MSCQNISSGAVKTVRGVLQARGIQIKDKKLSRGENTNTIDRFLEVIKDDDYLRHVINSYMDRNNINIDSISNQKITDDHDQQQSMGLSTWLNIELEKSQVVNAFNKIIVDDINNGYFENQIKKQEEKKQDNKSETTENNETPQQKTLNLLEERKKYYQSNLKFDNEKHEYTIEGEVIDTTPSTLAGEIIGDKIQKVEEHKGFWTREEVEKETDKVFLFGDNTEDRKNGYKPSSTQAVIRGLPNAIGIDTKKNRGTNEDSYFTDDDFNEFKNQVDEAIRKAKESGKTIVLPEDGIGTGKAQLKSRAPKCFDYLQKELNKLLHPQFLEVSSVLGTTYDTIARDWFAGNLKEQYPNVNKKQIEDFIESLQKLKKEIEKDHPGCKIITDEDSLRVSGIINGKTIAGTMDMLVVDTNGDVWIYDFKTTRSKDIKSDSSKHKKYTVQQVLYKECLKTEGISVKGCKLVQIDNYYAYPNNEVDNNPNLGKDRGKKHNYRISKNSKNEDIIEVSVDDNDYQLIESTEAAVGGEYSKTLDILTSDHLEALNQIEVKPLKNKKEQSTINETKQEKNDKNTQQEEKENQSKIINYTPKESSIEIQETPRTQAEWEMGIEIFNRRVHSIARKVVQKAELFIEEQLEALKNEEDNVIKSGEQKKAYDNSNTRLKQAFIDYRSESNNERGLTSILEEIRQEYIEYLEEETDENIKKQLNLILKHWDSIIKAIPNDIEELEGTRIQVNTTLDSNKQVYTAEELNNDQEQKDLDANEDDEFAEERDSENLIFKIKEQDPHKSRSKEVRKALRSILMTDENGEPAVDDLGEPIYMDDTLTYRPIQEAMETITSPEEFFKPAMQINDKGELEYTYDEDNNLIAEFPILENMLEKYPWVSSVIDYLKAHPEAISIFYSNFRTDFTSATALVPKKGEKISRFSKPSLSFITLNARTSEQCLLEEAKKNYTMGFIQAEGHSIYNNYVEVNLDQVKNLLEYLNSKVTGNQKEIQNQKAAEALRALGFSVTKEDIEKSKDAANIINRVKAVASILQEGLEAGESIDDIFTYTYNGQKVYSVLKKALKKLSKITSDTGSSSYRHANKTKYSYSAPGYYTTLFKRLTSVSEENRKNILDKFKKSSFFYKNGKWRCKWLEDYENDEDLREKHELFNLESIYKDGQNVEYSKWSSEMITPAFIRVFFDQFNNKGTKYGYYNFPIFSDSPLVSFVKNKIYTTYTNKAGTTVSMEQQIIELLRDVVLQEYSRIQLVEKRAKAKIAAIQHFDKNGNKFQFMPELNTFKNEEGKTLLDILKVESASLDLENTTDYIKEQIDSFISKILEQNYNQFKEAKDENEKNDIIKALKDAGIEGVETIDTWESKFIEMYELGDKEDHEKLKKSYKKSFFKGKSTITDEDLSKKYKELQNKIKAIKEKNDKLYDQYLKIYFYNQFYATSQIIEITTTDPAFYKDQIDFQKRYKEVYAGGAKLNTKCEGGKEYERTIYLKDITRTSGGYQFISRIINNAYEQGRIDVYTRDSILSKMKDVNIADAQAYRSLKSTESLLKMAGLWEGGMSDLFEKVKNGDKLNVDDLQVVWQTIKPFVFSVIEKEDGFGGKILCPVQNKNSEMILTAMYALGGQLNQSPILKGLEKWMEENDVDVVQFESAVKAGAQTTISLDVSIEKVQQYMASSNIDFSFKYETLHKDDPDQTKIKNAISLNPLKVFKEVLDNLLDEGEISQQEYQDAYSQCENDENEVYNYLENNCKLTEKDVNSNPERYGNRKIGEFNPEVVTEIPYEDYSIQQPTPEHLFDAEAVFGSQFRNLILEDMPEDIDITINKGKFNEKHFSKASELKKYYYSRIIENLIHDYSEVAKDFDDIETLSKRLKKLTTGNPKYGSDFQNALEVVTINGEKCFNIPFENNNVRELVEDLLTSMFKNAVTKQRVKGAACILASNFGFSEDLNIVYQNENKEIINYKEWLKKNSRKESPNAKQEFIKWANEQVKNHKLSIAYAECYLPASSKKFYEPFFNKKTGELDFEKMERECPELLEGIGYRIPTEDKYSMIPFRVKGFLPQNSGSAIIMPSDLTQLAGSDFDVDKLYMMLNDFQTIKYDRQKAKKDFKQYLKETRQQERRDLREIFIDKNPELDGYVLKLKEFIRQFKESNSQYSDDTVNDLYQTLLKYSNILRQDTEDISDDEWAFIEDNKQRMAIYKDFLKNMKAAGYQEKDYYKQQNEEFSKWLETEEAKQIIKAQENFISFDDWYSENKEKYELDHPKFIKKEYNEEGRYDKGAVNNELIEISKQILQSQHGTESLLNPGNFDNAKLAARKARIIQDPNNSTSKLNSKILPDQEGSGGLLDKFMEYTGLSYDLTIRLLSFDGPTQLVDNDGNLVYNEDGSPVMVDIEYMNNFLKQYNVPHSLLSPYEFIYNHRQNMTGGALIGVYANGSSAHAKFQYTEGDQSHIEMKTPILMAESLGNGKFKNIELKKLDGIYSPFGEQTDSKDNVSQYGPRISKNIANFLASSVDNVKDPVLAWLNQELNNAELTNFMCRAGFTINQIMLIFNLPALRKNHNIITNQRWLNSVIDNCDTLLDNLKNDQDANIRELANLVEQDYNYLNTFGVTSEELAQVAIGMDFNLGNDQILKEIKNQKLDKDNISIYARQLAMNLKVYKMLSSLASNYNQFSSTTQISRFDSPNGAIDISLIKSLLQVYKVEDYRYKYIEGEEAAKNCTIIGLDNKVVKPLETEDPMNTKELLKFINQSERPMLQAFFTLGIDAPIRVLSKHFAILGQPMQSVIKEIANNYPYAFTDDLAKIISNSFYRYLISDSEEFGGNDFKDERNYYLYTFPYKFMRLKTNKKFRNYNIIKRLFTSKGKIQLANSTHLERPTLNKLGQELTSMLQSDDKDLKQMAIDLYKYSVYENALSFGPTSFSTLFTSSFQSSFKESIASLRNAGNKAKTDELYIERFRKQLYANYVEELATDVQLDEDDEKALFKKGYSDTIIIPKNSRAAVYNKEMDKQIPLLKFYDANNHEYQYYIETDTPFSYAKITPRNASVPCFNSNISNIEELRNMDLSEEEQAKIREYYAAPKDTSAADTEDTAKASPVDSKPDNTVPNNTVPENESSLGKQLNRLNDNIENLVNVLSGKSINNLKVTQDETKKESKIQFPQDFTKIKKEAKKEQDSFCKSNSIFNNLKDVF